VQALAKPTDGAVNVTLKETGRAPPPGVLDISPVFSVESDASLPPMALSIPVTSNQWLFADQSTGVYFSRDEESFRLLTDSYANAGFMQTTLPEGGFFFVGSIAREGDCSSF